MLFVDSDEIIPPELAREIETVTTGSEKIYQGILFHAKIISVVGDLPMGDQ